jgi:hypothetical protein
MSGYGGAGKAALLRNNSQAYLFQMETNLVGKASIALQPERINRSFYPWGVSFQAYFTDVNGNPANPGAFEIDFQTTDIDQDNQYSTASAMNTLANPATFVGRVELTAFYAKFIRAFVKSLTNPVYVTILATR